LQVCYLYREFVSQGYQLIHGVVWRYVGCGADIAFIDAPVAVAEPTEAETSAAE